MLEQYNVIALPAFENNYLWLLLDGSDAVLIDPGDAQVCIDALEKFHLNLDAVLITHHHKDHIGGLSTIKQSYDCPVYGPEDSRIPGITNKLTEADSLHWKSHQFHVWHTPGHTQSHIVYWNQMKSHLFCGDMLFGAGCGRHMEGQISDLYYSLQRIASLDLKTLIFCAHEYTLQNLKFAATLEPDNQQIRERMEEAKRIREANQPTIPTHLKIEKETNPFLRSHLIPIRKKLDLISTDAAIQDFLAPFTFRSKDEFYFAVMRGWKNIYV